MLGGELFKLTRQRLNWLLLLMLAGTTSIYYLFSLGAPRLREFLLADPLGSYVSLMSRELAIIRMFIGLFLMIATARMVGLEYQQGTIRVLLARGSGRIQLLGAKLLAMTITALVVFAGCLLLATVLAVALTAIIAGSLTPLQSLTAEFWQDTGLYTVTVLISMGATILMATAMTAVSRSLPFGLGASIGYFAADNFLVPILGLVTVATGNDFWVKITGYFLGPELNLMPQVVAPKFHGEPLTSVGVQPYVHYDGAHALLTALAYAVVFLGASIYLTWRKDVLE
jgi:ABC-type transport system involved in multi-copper enzyme maturation permease subunit